MKIELRNTGLVILLFACLAANAAGQDAEGFKLNNRSTFSIPGKERDPFWPIGWVKQAGPAASSESRVEFSTDGFVLTSVLMGQPALAVINGKEYAEGEMISCEMGGQKISIPLVSVQDGSVVLRYQDKNYTIQLHRRGEEQKQIAKTEETRLSQALQ